jgi:hypothetical protein
MADIEATGLGDLAKQFREMESKGPGRHGMRRAIGATVTDWSGHRERRAGRTLWCVLALCWIARLAATTTGATALWGIHSAAYLPDWFAWATLGLFGAALVPPIGAALTRELERVGRQYETPSNKALLWLFATVAVGMLYLPDRVGFTGDSLLRLSSAKASGSPVTIFPQALPLDLWLHITVPHEVARLRIAPVEATSRVLDALEAGCLALLVVTLVRRSGARGAALANASLVILAGGSLAIFTGLSKAFTELVVLAAALAVSTFPGSSSFGRAVSTLAIFALALALHRAALILTPVVVFGLAGWLGTSARREPPVKRWAIAVMILVGIALAGKAFVPIASRDLPGGLVWLSHRTSSDSLGMRMLDVANLVFFLVPSLVLVPAVLLDSRVRDGFRGLGGWWYACLAIPSALLIGLVDAPQGYFRDWDMFTTAGLLLSVVSALAIGRFFSRTPQYAWLGAAVALSTVVPCMQQLVLQSDSQAGLRRVASFAEAYPPHRNEVQRASVLAFLGKRAWDSGDVASAALYGRRAAELVPTPSMLTLWGDAEEEQGHLAAAESIYVRLAAASPTNIRAWLGLARVRLSSGRPLEAAAAAESALAIQPGSTYAADLLRAARASRPR